jgi:integrase
MAKVIERLSDIEIKAAIKKSHKTTSPAYLPDGKGLYLRVTPGGTATFLYRYFEAGNQHWIQLGYYPTLSLDDARDRAQEQRNLRRNGTDPAAERKRQEAEKQAAEAARKAADERAQAEALLAAAKTKTFRECTLAYYEAHKLELDNAKFRASWLRSLEIHVFPILGDLPVADIDRQLVKRVLTPIWTTKTKTAKDLRGRISKILGWAAEEGYRPDGPNPAAWADALEHSLAKPSKITRVERHKPLPVTDVVAFMAKLRAVDTIVARRLEFTILNASRVGEVRLAKWSEIDLAKKTWTIPVRRMKTRQHDWAEDHIVPLATAALSILENLKARSTVEPQNYVFANRRGRPIAESSTRRLTQMLTGDPE